MLDIDRVHQGLHREANCRIVIDDENGGLCVFAGRHDAWVISDWCKLEQNSREFASPAGPESPGKPLTTLIQAL